MSNNESEIEVTVPTEITKKKFLNKFSSKTKEAILFYIMVFPFASMFIVIKLVPFARGIYLSFTNFTGYNLDRVRFTGLKNYIRVFNDNDAMYALFQTLKIGVITVPLTMIVGLMLALFLNRPMRGVRIYRTIAYLPSIIPAVATGMLWRMMFNKDAGVINLILSQLFGIKPINWLGYDYALYALIIMMLWGSSAGLLINLAALKDIPVELYEAADMDGASGIRKLFKITLPIISPILFFNLVLGIIGGLQLYAQPVLLAPGVNGVLNVPPTPIYTYLVHTYQQIFGMARYGYGLAMIWVLFIIINLMTLIVFKTSKYWVFNENTDGKRRGKAK